MSPNQDAGELISRLWPRTEKANVEAPAHGQVWRSKIAIAKQDKPSKRAAKGSIMRRATLDCYHGEINALYSNEASDDQLGNLPKGTDLGTTKNLLRKALALKCAAVPNDAPDDADLFGFGVDSLQVLALCSTLSHACGSGKEKITV